MLRKSELTAAVKLEQAVGQRRYGHFDYDANKAIGPDPGSSSVLRGCSSRAVTKTMHADPPVRVVDKRTGRINYKPAR